jgi:proline utilization trans-activator
MRCQKIWWTVYVLERQISVLLGTPLSMSDNDIGTSLPVFPDSSLRTATLDIHVGLSKVFSRIVNGMYVASSLGDKP